MRRLASHVMASEVDNIQYSILSRPDAKSTRSASQGSADVVHRRRILYMAVRMNSY